MKMSINKLFKTRTILAFAFLLSAILGIHRYCAIKELRRDNARLKTRIAQLENGHADNDHPSKTGAIAIQPPLSNSNEVQRLKSELLKREDQIRQVQNEINSAVVSASNLPPGVRNLVLPRSTWNSTGNSTPEDAFKALLLAVSRGDIAGIQSGLTAREQREMAREINKTTENEFTSDLTNHFGQASELRILRVQTNDDRVSFCYFIGGLDQYRRKGWIGFEKIGDQWLCPQIPFDWFHK
jgi:hypothetical protein